MKLILLLIVIIISASTPSSVEATMKDGVRHQLRRLADCEGNFLNQVGCVVGGAAQTVTDVAKNATNDLTSGYATGANSTTSSGIRAQTSPLAVVFVLAAVLHNVVAVAGW